MPIVVVGTEKNLAALHPRLFGRKVSGKDALDAAAAIRRANPGVDLDALTPGTVLTVPDSPSIRVRGELALDDATRQALAGLADHGKRSLDEIADTAARREAEGKAERQRTLKAVDSIGGETPRPRERGLTKDLETARAALTAEDDRASERAAGLKDAQAEWSAGLDALRELVGVER